MSSPARWRGWKQLREFRELPAPEALQIQRALFGIDLDLPALHREGPDEGIESMATSLADLLHRHGIRIEPLPG